MEDTETRIKQIMVEYIDGINDASEISNDEDLFAIGINSVTGIRIFVAIENEFGFEFDDKNLNPESY